MFVEAISLISFCLMGYVAWYYRCKADFDGLTGLYNKDWFMCRKNSGLYREMKHSAENGSSLGVIAIDLDGFKTINDTKGHSEGDRILKLAASAIESAVSARVAKTITARNGGDEFVVTLRGSDRSDAAYHGYKILNAITQYSGLTASIGVHIFEYESGRIRVKPEFDYADRASYFVKQNGKNDVHCSWNM